MPQEFPAQRATPDWTYWSKLRHVDLITAVALSLNLDPGDESFFHLIVRKGMEIAYQFKNQKYQERLSIAINHLGFNNAEGFQVYDLANDYPASSRIDLPSFGLWARGLGFHLPAEFPVEGQAATHAPLPESDGKYTLKLDVHCAAIIKLAEIVNKNYEKAPNGGLLHRTGCGQKKVGLEIDAAFKWKNTIKNVKASKEGARLAARFLDKKK